MSKLKTIPNNADVQAFLNTIEQEQKRQDSQTLLRMMQEITGEAPQMWGKSIVGFGSYHYKYDSGREGDWFLTGFSPRKQSLTLYIMSSCAKYENLLAQLGKHKIGKSCLYIKKLSDINEGILRELITQSVVYVQEKCAT